MKVGDVVKIKKLENYAYGGSFKYFVSNWNNVNRGTICKIIKDWTNTKVYVTQNNNSYIFIEEELELINWLKII